MTTTLARPPLKPAQPTTPRPKHGLNCLSSYALWALVAVVALEFAARATYPWWTGERFSYPYRSYIWWATRDWNLAQEEKPAPGVVLLGSSLMFHALIGGDATRYNRPENAAFHHRGSYLEELLSEPGKPIKTFSFAIAGQMASDAYAITKALVGQSKAPPHAIIYGIAPRDLMDNLLSSPASTYTFRYVSRLANLDDIAKAPAPFWDQVERQFEQISFIYRQRLDFVYLQHNLAETVLSQVGFKDMSNIRVPIKLRRVAMLELPEDIGPNEVIIDPYRASEGFEDNSKEYKKRYAHLDRHQYAFQLSFLSKLAEVCREKNIRLYLVNMPITTENQALIPPGFYSQYLGSLQELSRASGASFIDLNQPEIFAHRHFRDTVHLNGLGAELFLQQLARQLNNSAIAQSSGH